MVNFNFSDNGTIITIIKLLHSHSACPERGTRTVAQPCSKRPALQGPLWPPRYHQTYSTYTSLYTPQISSNLFNLYISVHPPDIIKLVQLIHLCTPPDIIKLVQLIHLCTPPDIIKLVQFIDLCTPPICSNLFN